MQYRDDGYLPEALLNYLVRLGWSSGDQEIFTREEMIKLFSLGAVSKSASAFNTDKLLWLNHHYINTLAPEYVATHLQWHIEQENIDTRNGPQLAELVKLLGERCKTLKEMAQSCRYFYEDFSEFDADVAKTPPPGGASAAGSGARQAVGDYGLVSRKRPPRDSGHGG